MGRRLNRRFDPKATDAGIPIKRCKQCNLIYCDPLPKPHSIEQHYGTPPEKYWRSSYFERDPEYFSVPIQEAKRLLDFQEGMRALDIGAGIGKATLAMQDAGFMVTSLEPSEPFRRMAVEKMGLREENLVGRTIEDADLPKNTFDFITFGAVLEHLYSPSDAIERALTWLKDGGIIHVSVPSSRHLMSYLANTYFRMRGTQYVTNCSPLHKPYHLYEFGLKSFELHGAAAGYTIANHQVSVCTIFNVPKVAHWPLHQIMKHTNTGMQLSVWLRRNAER